MRGGSRVANVAGDANPGSGTVLVAKVPPKGVGVGVDPDMAWPPRSHVRLARRL